MAERKHSIVINQFKGVDYKSNDLIRDPSYFKESENLELTYTGGVRGRIGYRQLWPNFGFSSMHKHIYTDIDGNVKEELLFCNGHLWKYAETSFTINTTLPVILYYDPAKEIKATLSTGEVLSHPQLTLSVGGLKFGLAEYNIGTLWEALIANGITISQYPTATQTRNWLKITSSDTFVAPTGSATQDLSALRDVLPNDIFGVWDSTYRYYIPVLMTYATAPNIIKLRHPSYVVSLQLALGYAGIAGVRADSIISVSGNIITFAYPEPIPSCTHFKQVSANASETCDHSLLAIYSVYDTAVLDTGQSEVEYSFLSAADSCFISADKVVLASNLPN